MPAEAKVNRKDKRIIVENLRRVLLKEYLMNETRRAGFGGLDIQRTPMGTRVTLLAERPGLVIGRKGGAIKALTEAVEQRFRFDNPQIEVQEVASPALNAQIMAEKLANALERGWHFRRAGHSTVRRMMEAGATGCLVVIAGKLTGQQALEQVVDVAALGPPHQDDTAGAETRHRTGHAVQNAATATNTTKDATKRRGNHREEGAHRERAAHADAADRAHHARPRHQV